MVGNKMRLQGEDLNGAAPRDSALRGREWRQGHGYGGTEVGELAEDPDKSPAKAVWLLLGPGLFRPKSFVLDHTVRYIVASGLEKWLW